MEQSPSTCTLNELKKPTPATWIHLPAAPHTHTFILLHGRGSVGSIFGQGFVLLSQSSNGLNLAEEFPGVKWVCPTASKRRAAAHNRATINQWYDIPGPGHRTDDPGSIEGLIETVRWLRELVHTEAAELSGDCGRVLVGGLSQGCAASVYALLAGELGPVGGYVGISGCCPFGGVVVSEFLQERVYDDAAIAQEDSVVFEEDDAGKKEPLSLPVQAVNFLRENIGLSPLPAPQHHDIEEQGDTILSQIQHIPVLLGHGSLDDKVPVSLGKEMISIMTAVGIESVVFKEYPDLGHWYKIPNEIDDIAEFVKEKAGVSPAKT